MSTPLLKTKLYVPHVRRDPSTGLRTRLVSRPRLIERLNTVKVHTRNIYGKLGVHNRTQAVARSQELGLLPRRGIERDTVDG